MSEIRNYSIDTYRANALNEEFFDEHHNPADIVRTNITENIVCYYEEESISETFLIEIKFPFKRGKASQAIKKCKHTRNLLHTILPNKKFGIDIYNLGNRLFLRRLLF